MINITFSESAGGGLKMGLALLSHQQTSAAQSSSDKEIKHSYQPTANEAVYCFPLMLSIGKILDKDFFSQRNEILQQLYHDLPKDFPDKAQMAKTIIEPAKQQLKMLKKCLQDKETIRIWYSHAPDDLCGLYWFCHILQQWQLLNTVYLLKLPDWDYQNKDCIYLYRHWGEITPKAFLSYLPLQQVAPQTLIQYYAQCWHVLQTENGSLRSLINNHLHTVPLTFYDFLIIKAFTEFHEPVVEAYVIGKLLGNEAIGVHDGFLHLRIQHLLQENILTCIVKADEKPYYDKLLLTKYLKY